MHPKMTNPPKQIPLRRSWIYKYLAPPEPICVEKHERFLEPVLAEPKIGSVGAKFL
jgi:hypothetical protein